MLPEAFTRNAERVRRFEHEALAAEALYIVAELQYKIRAIKFAK
jgi:hypothetical protein